MLTRHVRPIIHGIPELGRAITGCAVVDGFVPPIIGLAHEGLVLPIYGALQPASLLFPKDAPVDDVHGIAEAVCIGITIRKVPVGRTLVVGKRVTG